jgi:hypothetical protein
VKETIEYCKESLCVDVGGEQGDGRLARQEVVGVEEEEVKEAPAGVLVNVVGNCVVRGVGEVGQAVGQGEWLKG